MRQPPRLEVSEYTSDPATSVSPVFAKASVPACWVTIIEPRPVGNAFAALSI